MDSRYGMYSICGNNDAYGRRGMSVEITFRGTVCRMRNGESFCASYHVQV